MDLEASVRDLQKHRGASVVVAGDRQPPGVHGLAHAINQALDNVGKTVIYTDPIEANPVDQMASLRELVKDMESGAVRILLMLGGNPVYTAPADLDFAEDLAKVPLSGSLRPLRGRNVGYCHWHIPETHYLEAWSDTRVRRHGDDRATVDRAALQRRSSHEVLAAMLRRPDETAHDIVRNYWHRQRIAGDFEPLAGARSCTMAWSQVRMFHRRR